MGKNNKARRMLKKKKKKAKAARNRNWDSQSVLPYHGSKYRTEELVMLHMATETAINECFAISGRTITDHQVRETLTRLVLQIRKGLLRLEDGRLDSEGNHDDAVDLLEWNICARLRSFFETNDYPGRDNLIGVFRSIMGSIEARGSMHPKSRGYLEFLEGFLQDLGVTTKRISVDELEELGAIGHNV